MHQTPTCVAGFSHSSFVFGYEAFVHRTNIGANQVPPGALVSFLQRGIQYVEMQSNLNEVGLRALPCMDLGFSLRVLSLWISLPGGPKPPHPPQAAHDWASPMTSYSTCPIGIRAVLVARPIPMPGREEP